MTPPTRAGRAVAGLAVAVLALSACTTQPDPQPSVPLGTPTPTPSASASVSAEQRAAEATVLEANEVFFATMSGTGDPNDVNTVMRSADGAADGYVASYLKLYAQFVGQDMLYQGERTVRVVGSTPSEGGDDRRAYAVDACVDNRGWQLVDTSGTHVADPEHEVEAITYTVEEWPEGWYVTGEAEGDFACV